MLPMMDQKRGRRLRAAALLVPAVTSLSAPAIKVRFIPKGGGADVLTSVPENMNLLNAADAAGLKIPRACRNGLCGACECTLVTADGDERYMRACSTTIKLTDVSGGEYVVDLTKKKKKRAADADADDDEEEEDDDVMAASMARFSDDWENSYVPDYHAENNDKPSYLRDYDDDDGGGGGFGTGDWTDFHSAAGSGYGGDALDPPQEDWRQLALGSGVGEDDVFGGPRREPWEDFVEAKQKAAAADDDDDDDDLFGAGGLAPWEQIQ